MPANEPNDSLAAALTQVTERMTALVHDEIELAKAEMEQKAKSLMRGGIAVAAGGVFGIFAVIVGLGTLAWGLNSALSSLWLGYLITFVVLIALTVFTFLFAWSKLKVGAPKPTLAMEEAQKIRATITSARPEPGA